jgi:hypothetical protein
MRCSQPNATRDNYTVRGWRNRQSRVRGHEKVRAAALPTVPQHEDLVAHRETNLRGHVFTDKRWLAADPTLGPWLKTPDLLVVQTGAWVLPDQRPLSEELETFLEAGQPPTCFGSGWAKRVHELGIGKPHTHRCRATGPRPPLQRARTLRRRDAGVWPHPLPRTGHRGQETAVQLRRALVDFKGSGATRAVDFGPGAGCDPAGGPAVGAIDRHVASVGEEAAELRCSTPAVRARDRAWKTGLGSLVVGLFRCGWVRVCSQGALTTL